MKAQNPIDAQVRRRRTNNLTNQYSWQFLKAAWLFAFALAVTFTILEYNWEYNRRVDDTLTISVRLNFSMVFLYTSYVVAGMMLTRLVRPSRKVVSFAGLVVCAGAVIFILHNYINLGIGTFAGSFGIYYSDIILMFFVIVSLCSGVFIQSRLGNGLYKGRTVRTALVIAIAAAAVYILCKISYTRAYLLMGEIGLQTILSIQFLAYMALIIAAAVLFRSRIAYRLTRPVIVKLALVVISMISLPFVRGDNHHIRDAIIIIPCLIAFAFCVPALVRGLINGVRQI